MTQTMIFRSLDSNGDWNFGRGQTDYLQSNAAIGANIQTRVLSWLNDCFFSMNAGIDWLNRLGDAGQRDLLELDIRRIIQQSTGVTGITKVDIIINGRALTATYNIDTIFSQSYINSVTQQINLGTQ
jgi:hypothetical protein